MGSGDLQVLKDILVLTKLLELTLCGPAQPC